MPRRRRTKSRKSISWKGILLIAILGVLALPVAGGFWLKFWLDEEKLVELIEENLNARAQVDSVELSIFQFPAEVHLKGLTLYPRDGAKQGHQPSIATENCTLAVEVMPLFSRRLDLLSIDIDGGAINFVLAEDGSDNLLPLFNSPDEADSAETTDDSAGSQGTELTETSETEVNVDELGWGVGIREITLKNIQLHTRILSADLRVECPNLQLQAKDIELDPRQLSTSNRASLSFQGNFSVNSNTTPVIHYGEAHLDATSVTRIFDPANGDLDPDVELSVMLGEDSYLSTRIPTIEGWWEKLRIVNQIGVKIGQLPEKATFDQHPISLHYHRDVVTLRKQVNLDLADWQLALMPPSVCNIASTDHQIQAELRTSQIHGTMVSDLVEKFIDSSPKLIRDILRQELLDNWFRDGRLIVKVNSEGTFDDPDLGVESQLPDADSLLDKAKDKAGDLLKSLFD